MIVSRVRPILYCVIVALGLSVASTAEERPLPDRLTAAILVKLLELDETTAGKMQLRIHVVDDISLAESLRGLIGRKIGDGTLSSVSIGWDLPTKGTDVLLFTKNRNVGEYVNYARKHNVLTVANGSRFLAQGVSLAIFDDEGMPGILLNNGSSIREGQQWNPEILEIAEVYAE